MPKSRTLGGEAMQSGGNSLGAPFLDSVIAGLDFDIVERLGAGFGQAAPQQRSAVTEETGAVET